jgi:catechol 2,3-dioxygenase-like lactoylglutathione lyase family enzyme
VDPARIETRSVTITRAVPNKRSERPADTRDFFVGLLGFEVAMDMGWVVTVASPTNPSVQVTIVGNDDMSAPGISVGVADVDAVHAKAVEQGFEIIYPLRDEEWGVRHFMLREPERHGRQRRVPPLRLSAPGWRTSCEAKLGLVRRGRVLRRSAGAMTARPAEWAAAAASPRGGIPSTHCDRSAA